MQNGKEQVLRWHPPEEGRVKINVDAHVVAGNSWFSCGLVVRDHEAKFVRVKVFKSARIVPVIEAEAGAILEAIKWSSSMGLQNVEIECDSMNAVQAINNGIESYLEAGVVFQECRNLLKDRRDVLLSYVKKQA